MTPCVAILVRSKGGLDSKCEHRLLPGHLCIRTFSSVYLMDAGCAVQPFKHATGKKSMFVIRRAEAQIDMNP